MRSTISVLAWVTIMALMSFAAAAAPCLDATGSREIAQGLLSVGRFKDAADRPETAYILRLASPVCLTGTDEEDKVEGARTIHVYSSKVTLQRRLRSLVGRRIRVEGRPFGAITAHHHAPIVMDVARIAPL